MFMFVILKGKIIDLTFDFYVYVCDRVWICVCVCDFGTKNHKSKFVFLILGLAGHEGTGLARARLGGIGVKKKNSLNKWTKSKFLR